jgi:peptide/nickel transport system ATP-binding protein
LEKLLSIENLNVDFAMRTGTLQAVNDVSLSIDKGQRLGLVGESGAGMSVLGFSVINLISKPGYIASGSIRFRGREISTCDAKQMREIRGNRISMIFQDPP